MGEAIERLLMLAGTEVVSGYTRTSKLGKTVRVGTYTRSPGDMTDKQIIDELRTMTTSGGDRTRRVQLEREAAKRLHKGTWQINTRPLFRTDAMRRTAPILHKSKAGQTAPTSKIHQVEVKQRKLFGGHKKETHGVEHADHGVGQKATAAHRKEVRKLRKILKGHLSPEDRKKVETRLNSLLRELGVRNAELFMSRED